MATPARSRRKAKTLQEWFDGLSPGGQEEVISFGRKLVGLRRSSPRHRGERISVELKTFMRHLRRHLKDHGIPEWAADGEHLHAIGIEAERRERDRCRRDGEDMEAAEVVKRIARARENAVRREVKEEKDRLPLVDEHGAPLRKLEIEARVKEGLTPEPRSVTSLRREHRASARDLR